MYGELARSIGLIKYVELFIVIEAMKKDLISSLQPKDLYNYAKLFGLHGIFRKFEGIENIDEKKLKK